MFVGVARLTLQIADSGSLKSKRQVLRRITDRLKARFNVSVAEVEDQDLWQRATIALAVVSSDTCSGSGRDLFEVFTRLGRLYRIGPDAGAAGGRRS